MSGWLKVQGVLAAANWAGGAVGVLGLARVGGGELFATPTMGVGAFLRSRLDGSRLTFDARFPVGGSDLRQSEEQARTMLLTAVALGETDDPFWYARARGGWVLRLGLTHRIPLPWAWNVWIALGGAYGLISTETPTTMSLGGLAVRQTSLIGGHLDLLVGDASSGFRMGVRARLGMGSSTTTEALLPFHMALLAGLEIDQGVSVELAAGFTIVPLAAELFGDSSLGHLALPSLTLRVNLFPITLAVGEPR